MSQGANQNGSDIEQAMPERSSLLRNVAVNRSGPIFWMIAWLGTVLGGGVFGALEDGSLGCIVGVICAGVAAAPILSTFALLTWIFWLSRVRVAVAALAGATTGVAAAAAVVDWLWFSDSYELALILAGTIGGVGGALPSGLYHNWSRRVGRASGHAGGAAWQFSLQDLFLRIAAVAVSLAVLSWLINECGRAQF